MRCLRVLFALCVPLSVACGGSSSGSDAAVDAGDAAVDSASPDAADDSATDAALDTGAPTGDVCDAMGLPRAEFLASTGSGFGDVAGDFTVDTLSGDPWTLSEHFSGCESYVFLNYAAVPDGDALWRSFADGLVENSPQNVQFFFTSYESDAAAARARVEAMRANIEDSLSRIDDAAAEAFRARVHYVTTPLLELVGSVGDRARAQPGIALAFAIARDQRFDPVGSLAQVTSVGFVSRLAMAAYVGHYYNYRAALRERLAAEPTPTLVPVISAETLSERVVDRPIALPDAAAMAGFDTLELDVQLTCHSGARDCSEWDRIAGIELCMNDACDDRRELVRWITPYSRPGRRRWVIDATPFLGLLADGGARTLRVVMGPSWERATEREVNISMRLFVAGAAETSIDVQRAFTGGAFDASYNASQAPFHFTPPAGTTRVELVILVSGHGQTDGDGCAEWCNHEHEFTITGKPPHRVSFEGEAGVAMGCADKSREGVIPGQYGNWAPGRAGWCPGLPVAARRIDITSDVDLTADNELTYRGRFAGGEPRGGNIDLSAYVVSYR
ncbi:MAG: hypothetical protein GXP55_14030 [Deltaproteobacteria bacterium]|nr:hypothetical protein [Deltaproteobacteria bacterium]